MKRQNKDDKVLLAFLNILILLISFELAYTQTDERTKGVNENCMAISSYDLFDLFKLSSKVEKLEKDDGTIYVQFCKNYANYTSSVVYIGKEGKVISLAGNINGEKDSKNKVIVLNHNDDANKGNKTTKVTLHLAKGQQCISNPDKFYDFSIVLTCQKNKPYTFVSINSYNPKDTCSFVMEVNADEACGNIDEYEISKMLGENNIKIGIIFFIIGPLLAIFGYKYIKYAIFVVCIIVFPCIGFFIFCGIFGISNDIAVYIILFVFLLMGIGVAFFITRKHKYLKFYMCIVGGVFGALIGLFIYSVVISLIETTLQEIIYYILIIAFAAAGVILGIFAPKFTCIVGSSTIGGYILMRGISLFLYSQVRYIDENQIFDYARTGNYEKIGEMITSWFYIYPVIFIIFSVAFSFVQYKLNPKQNDVDDYKELEGKFEHSTIIKDFKVTTSSSEDQETPEEAIMTEKE